jgi:hypothetical protein
VALVVLLCTGCGALARNATSPGTFQPGKASPATASTLADLRNRPLNSPAMGAGGACPITSSHDLSPVVNSAKGKGPGFGFGPGPAYLSGITQLYPGGADGEVWLAEPTYRGPVLVRRRQVNGTQLVSFSEPITFPGEGFSSAGRPPPGKPVATVTVQGSAIPFYKELDLPAASSADAQGFWRQFFASTHIEAPGCYAFQVDGLSFSVVIVFQVPDAARGGG